MYTYMYMYTSNIVGTTVLCVGYAGKGVKVRAFTESSIKRKRVSASKIGGGGCICDTAQGTRTWGLGTLLFQENIAKF